MKKVRSQKQEVRSKKSEARSQKQEKTGSSLSCLLPLTSRLLPLASCLSFFGLLLTAYCLLLTVPSFAEEKTASPSIKVAILPWKVNAQEGMDYLKGAVSDMLASRIGSEATIEIVNDSSIKSSLSKYSQAEITEDVAANVGKEVGADYIIYGSITVISDSVSIDAKTVALKKAMPPFFSSSQDKGLQNILSLVDGIARDTKVKILSAEGIIQKEDGGKPAATKEKPAERTSDDEFIIAEKSDSKVVWRSHQFDTAMKYVEIADVDGDGRNEIIMIDSHNLFIYRLNNQTFELIKEFKGNLSVKNYTISVADINNNRIPEIYIARMVGGRVDSYMIEYADNEYKTIESNIKWFIRTLREPSSDAILIGQKYSDTYGFYGPINRLDWKDGKLHEVSAIDVPKNLNLYNFGMANLGNDKTIDIIALDERDYLHIYNKDNSGLWKDTWKSGEFYGGSLNRLEFGASSTSQESGDFIDIKAKVFNYDIDGDGSDEILISRNDPGAIGRYFKKITSYKSGEIINLVWEGYVLEEKWRTKKIDGYIADYAVSDMDNDGQRELVVLVVTGDGTDKSHIMAYKLKKTL